MENVESLPNLVSVRCMAKGIGRIRLRFDYPLFVGSGKLFADGSLMIRQKGALKPVIFELMLQTDFSVN